MDKIGSIPERHKDAFLLWRGGNTLATISKQDGMPSERTLIRWKKDDGWDEKNKGIADLVKHHLSYMQAGGDLQTQLAAHDTYRLQQIQMLEGIVADKITSGEISPASWSDLMATLKFTANETRLILGQPTQITDHTHRYKKMSDEELDGELKSKEVALEKMEDGSYG